MWKALNVIPMCMAQQQVEMPNGSLQQGLAKPSDPGSGIKHNDSGARIDFDAGCVAAITKNVGCRYGKGAADTPEVNFHRRSIATNRLNNKQWHGPRRMPDLVLFVI